MTDLDLASVLRKTEMGVDAIKTRDRALTPKMRMLLIMVDGVKTVEEHTKALSNPEESLQLLGGLLSAGYVLELDLPKPVAPPPGVASNESDEALTAAMRRATHLLEDLLGPDSEALCLQLERCTNQTRFNAKVAEISRVVAGMRSERKAAEFLLAATY